MTPEQRDLVQASFAKVMPISAQAADLFYTRLFDIDPKLRTLFKGDIVEQGRKLMSMLHVVIANLQRIEELAPSIRDLARRHVEYGVSHGDYDTVGAALIWTLEKGLASDFTPETRDAWVACYGALAGIMRAADIGTNANPN